MVQIQVFISLRSESCTSDRAGINDKAVREFTFGWISYVGFSARRKRALLSIISNFYEMMGGFS